MRGCCHRSILIKGSKQNWIDKELEEEKKRLEGKEGRNADIWPCQDLKCTNIALSLKVKPGSTMPFPKALWTKLVESGFVKRVKDMYPNHGFAGLKLECVCSCGLEKRKEITHMYILIVTAICHQADSPQYPPIPLTTTLVRKGKTDCGLDPDFCGIGFMLQTIITKWIATPAKDIIEDTQPHDSESKYTDYWTSILPQPFNLSRAEEAVEAVGLESLKNPVILAHIRRTDKEKVGLSLFSFSLFPSPPSSWFKNKGRYV